MSKHVLSNNISATARQPYTKVTHEHYNAMIDELASAFGKFVVGNLADFTVLYGCVNSDAPNADITAGAIYYNGEIYLCDAFVDATISDDIVGTITTTYATGDPVLFTDLASYNVHQIKKIVWSDATAGSGDIDYSDLFFAGGLADEWTTVPYDSALLDASSGTWTIPASPTDNFKVKYKKIGKTVTYSIRIKNSTVSSTPASLRLYLSDGMTINADANFNFLNLGQYVNGNDTPTSDALRVEANAGAIEIRFTKFSGNHVAITGGFDIYCQITFEIA
jgi:hypothetical protein